MYERTCWQPELARCRGAARRSDPNELSTRPGTIVTIAAAASAAAAAAAGAVHFALLPHHAEGGSPKGSPSGPDLICRDGTSDLDPDVNRGCQGI